MLDVKHKKLEVYIAAKELVIECYAVLNKFTDADEKYGLILQIKRAVVSVLLNIAEGASRKTAADRRRFFTIARSSLIEVDCAFETAVDLEILREGDLGTLGEGMNKCFALISNLIAKT